MRIKLIATLILPTVLAYGQEYEPSLDILDPHERNYDSSLATEIQKFDFEGYSTPEDEKIFLEELKSEPPNIRTMEIAEWEFREKKDFASMLTLSFYGMISYLILGHTNQCLIFPSHERSSGQANDLRAVAMKNEVRWVINPVSIRTYLKGDDKLTTVRLIVYDSQKEQVMLDKEYTGDTKNPGLELTCEAGTLNCSINNVLKQSLRDVLTIILTD